MGPPEEAARGVFGRGRGTYSNPQTLLLACFSAVLVDGQIVADGRVELMLKMHRLCWLVGLGLGWKRK